MPSPTAFGVKVRIRGNRLPFIKAAFPQAVYLLMAKVAFDTQRLIQENIVAKNIVDTGTYLNSWKTVHRGGLSYSVQSNVHYGPYQEYGTSKGLAARPHVIPAADRAKSVLVEAFSKLEAAL